MKLKAGSLVAVLTVGAARGCGTEPACASEATGGCPFEADYSTRYHLTALAFTEEERRASNNYGFRDDIALRKQGKKLRLQAGGCPGHEFFQARPHTANSSSSCCSSCSSSFCSISCSTCSSICCACSSSDYISKSHHGKFTPNYHTYEFDFPRHPKVSDEVTSIRHAKLHDETHGDPFGVLVSGVLLLNQSTRSQLMTSHLFGMPTARINVKRGRPHPNRSVVISCERMLIKKQNA